VTEGTTRRKKPFYELPHYIYRLYDSAGTLLYIGVTITVNTRLLQQAKAQPWWAEVDPARTTETCYAKRAAALKAERAAIKSEHPKYNVQFSEINKPDPDDIEKKHYVVYRVYSADRRLLYIGMTFNLPRRIDDHGRGTWWWHAVDTIKLEHYNSRAAALRAEEAAIKRSGPLYNVMHADLTARDRAANSA
jgi:excinuclease UvrABC nuclease subunit